MTYLIVLASSLLAVVLVGLLAHEVRLRRALQRLLARLISRWRNEHDHEKPFAAGGDGADPDD